MDEENAAPLHHHLSSKPHGGGGAVLKTRISPAATSVHELLECPVCTNCMYPPIHQVGWLVSPFGLWSVSEV